jgi:hypothetical protein
VAAAAGGKVRRSQRQASKRAPPGRALAHRDPFARALLRRARALARRRLACWVGLGGPPACGECGPLSDECRWAALFNCRLASRRCPSRGNRPAPRASTARRSARSRRRRQAGRRSDGNHHQPQEAAPCGSVHHFLHLSMIPSHHPVVGLPVVSGSRRRTGDRSDSPVGWIEGPASHVGSGSLRRRRRSQRCTARKRSADATLDLPWRSGSASTRSDGRSTIVWRLRRLVNAATSVRRRRTPIACFLGSNRSSASSAMARTSASGTASGRISARSSDIGRIGDEIGRGGMISVEWKTRDIVEVGSSGPQPPDTLHQSVSFLVWAQVARASQARFHGRRSPSHAGAGRR